MTIDIFPLSLAAAGGVLLGLFYFFGLRWTVRKGLASPLAGLWFGASFLLRSGICLGGFYWIGAGDPLRILLALVGFLIARAIVTRTTGAAGFATDSEAVEAPHAP